MVLTVCICGGGNGAHVSAAYIGTKSQFRVNVFTRRPNDWISGMKANGGSLIVHTRRNGEADMVPLRGKVATVSSRAEDVVPEADIVILGGPANANAHLLKLVAPHLKKGAMLGALFAQGGFDWIARNALGRRADEVTLFGLLNIPWICRTLVYGKECKIVGPKRVLKLACLPASRGAEVSAVVTELFDIPTKHSIANFLNLALTPSNQIIHPARYYAIFHEWDGKTPYAPSALPPTLYEDFDDLSAHWLGLLDYELQSIKRVLLSKFPKLDLNGVLPIGQRICEQYGDEVTDKSSLRSIFNTNKGYRGVGTPVEKVAGGAIPNVHHRVFWEDMPYGLVILKDIAEMADLPTPSIDHMIMWHQQYMNKEYLVNGKLNRAILGETGAPSAFGITSLAQLVSTNLPAPTSSL